MITTPEALILGLVLICFIGSVLFKRWYITLPSLLLNGGLIFNAMMNSPYNNIMIFMFITLGIIELIMLVVEVKDAGSELGL